MKNVVLGVGGALGHDSNAALIVDGNLIGASQEERFTRNKHDGRFPESAILDCLTMAGLRPEDVDVCVFAEKGLQSYLYDQTERPSNWLSRWLSSKVPESWGGIYTVPARKLLPNAKFRYAWHHLSHVGGAFYTAPFENAAFLCIDGKGEDVNASVGIVNNETLEVLYHQPYENGIGLLYSLVTMHLGFPSFGSEYKVMGLSPYGKPKYVESLRSMLLEGKRGGVQLKENVKFKFRVMQDAINLVTVATGIPPRSDGQSLTSEYLDLAASLQILFEEEVLKMAQFVHDSIPSDNLIFCGGCAQNCVAAGKLRDSGLFKQVFNSPVGGDMASGLGAALLYERQRGGEVKPVQIAPRGFYLGSEPGLIPSEAEAYLVPYENSLHEFVAKILSEGKIVGWVRNGMELGARALGARSILADPRQPEMQSVLNMKIKFRESFRPFAPAVLSEEAGKWFDISYPSDYMQYTAYLKDEHRYPQPMNFNSLREQLNYERCAVPSIVHVDYSARLQTVDRKVHPDFHQLISEFHKITGVPILINTSFNVNGQPIVRNAQEAWECFVHTEIDFLVINESVFRHPLNKTREEKTAWLNQFEKYSK